MNPRILAAIAAFLSVLFRMHLSVASAGLVVTVSVPWFLLLALAAAAAGLMWLAFRRIRASGGFRSSPYPRTAARLAGA